MIIQEICECGLTVKSNSKKQLKYNLKIHRRGNNHKDIMANRKLLGLEVVEVGGKK